MEDYFEKIAILLSRRYIKKYRDTDFVTTSDLSDITLLNQKIKSQIETYLMIVSYAAFERSSGKEKITEEFELLHKDLKDMEAKDAITTDSFKSFKTISGYVKKILERSSNILFKSFGEQNHGASLKYMAPILLSIGIDVNTDLRLQNSLRLMAYYRGDYAHLGQNSMISRIMSQTDLIDYMSDCLILCEEIKVKASMKYN